MQREYWLRFLPRQYAATVAVKDYLSVTVPVHLRHFTMLGCRTRDDLSGPGAFDGHVVLVGLTPDAWTYEAGIDYARQSIASFKEGRGKNAVSSRRAVAVELIELVDGVSYGRSMTTSGGQLVQEIVLPPDKLQELLKDSEHNVNDFLFCRELGHMCLEHGRFDIQPIEFRNWFAATVIGRNEQPARMQQRWGTHARDAMLFSVVDHLRRQGMNALRNDASQEQLSACDATAQAALDCRLHGVTSYNTVKQIYLRANAAYKKHRG